MSTLKCHYIITVCPGALSEHTAHGHPCVVAKVQFASLGLAVHITELEVVVRGLVSGNMIHYGNLQQRLWSVLRL